MMRKVGFHCEGATVISHESPVAVETYASAMALWRAKHTRELHVLHSTGRITCTNLVLRKLLKIEMEYKILCAKLYSAFSWTEGKYASERPTRYFQEQLYLYY